MLRRVAMEIFVPITTSVLVAFVPLVHRRIVTMETPVLTILAMPRPALVLTLIILLLVKMEIPVPKMTIAKTDVAFLVHPNPVTTETRVPTILVMLTLENARTSTIMLTALMVMLVPRKMFALTELVFPALLQCAKTGTDVLTILAILLRVIVFTPITKLPALMVTNVPWMMSAKPEFVLAVETRTATTETSVLMILAIVGPVNVYILTILVHVRMVVAVH